MCLGKYDNENFALLNILDVEDEAVCGVKAHEIVHMLLALQTKWGCAEYYFNHIGRLIDSQYMYIAEILHNNCEVAQEMLAEFWEKLYIYRKNGEEAFLKAIEEERWKAPDNYNNYLKDVLNIIKDSENLSIDHIAFCLYRIAMSSMNIEFIDIPIESWENLKSDSKYWEELNHNTPNGVFKNLLIGFKNVLKSGNIEAYLIKLENEWSCADVEKRQQLVSDVLEYIKEICNKSRHFKEIEDYLSTIKCREIDIEKVDEYIVPVTFTKYDTVRGFGVTDIPMSIIFIYGDGNDILYTFKNKDFKNEYCNLYGLKQIVIMCACYSQKKMNFDAVSLSRLMKILKQYNLTRVISYKAYENNKELVRYLERDKIRYYVYCDRPYWSAKWTIQENCQDIKWNAIEYGKFDVICVEVGEYGILFIPVCNASVFYSDLETYYSGNKLLAKDMFERQSDVDKFNLVINCLFCV